jgi:hypothetical protein
LPPSVGLQERAGVFEWFWLTESGFWGYTPGMFCKECGSDWK